MPLIPRLPLTLANCLAGLLAIAALSARADQKESNPQPELRYPVNLDSPSEDERRLFGVISVENRQIEFAETAKVPHIANTQAAWFLHWPGKESVIVRERYFAPGSAPWDRAYKIVDDGRGGIATWVQRPVNGWLTGAKRIGASDPAGHWSVEVSIDDRPVHTFEYEISDDPETVKSFLRLAKAPDMEQLIYDRAKRECVEIHRGTGLSNCIIEKMAAIKAVLKFEKEIDPNSAYERTLYQQAFDGCGRIYRTGLTSLPCIKRWMDNQRAIDQLERRFGKRRL